MAFKRPIKLPKDTQGVEYYPATVTDAVVHPGLRKSLTDIIDNINASGVPIVDSVNELDDNSELGQVYSVVETSDEPIYLPLDNGSVGVLEFGYFNDGEFIDLPADIINLSISQGYSISGSAPVYSHKLSVTKDLTTNRIIFEFIHYLGTQKYIFEFDVSTLSFVQPISMYFGIGDCDFSTSESNLEFLRQFFIQKKYPKVAKLYTKNETGWEQYSELVDGSVTMSKLSQEVLDAINNSSSDTPGESTGSTIEIVNDLTSGGTDKALSAEMGKTLKETIDAIPVINENDFISVETLNDALKDYSKTDHNHDDKYITSSSLESTLSDYSKTDHNHDDKYITSSSLESTLSDYSKTDHNHDDKYMGITTQVNGTVGDVVITNMVPNKLYRYVGGGCTTITVNSLSSVVAGNYNEYMLEFEAGNGCTFVWPETLKWMNGQEPVFESGKIYQISIVNNLGVYAQF